MLWKLTGLDCINKQKGINMFICKYCDRNVKSSRGLTFHERLCKQNENREVHNNGLSGKSKSVEHKLAISFGMLSSDKVTGKAKTPELEAERIRKISASAKLNNGGHRHGSGRGIKGWYKGIFCDSSWELAFVLHCELSNTTIVRNTIKFPYTFDGVVLKYLPDFIVNNEYVEIKGYMSAKNKAKLDQFPHKITVYDKNDIKPILEKIVSVYGKDFIRLYEK